VIVMRIHELTILSPASCLSMIFSEHRHPPFGIML
jgi:hypothetical protein